MSRTKAVRRQRGSHRPWCRLSRAVGLSLCLMVLVAALATVPPALAQQSQSSGSPTFALIDQHGRPFTDRDLNAKPSVVHFGFTQCPVICPTTLYEVAARMRTLGPLADSVNFVFVTVDPARDTPAFLKAYIESFDNRIIGLSGDTAQISKLASWLGAAFARIETTKGDYTMDHAVNAFLIARGGRTFTPLYMGDGAKEGQVMQALQDLLKG